MTARATLLSDLIDKELELVGSYRRSLGQDPDTGTLNALSHTLINLEHVLREKMQEETRGVMEAVITILERDGELDAGHKDLVHAWMVGDAEHYAKAGSNFEEASAELNGLLDRLASARGRTLSPAGMNELQAAARGALRLAADIHFHQEQRARVQRFRDATADWSREDKKILARMLRGKLQSHED